MDNFPVELLLGNQKPKNWEEERAKYYFEKVLAVQDATFRIERYSIYFSEFYPATEKIPEAEAIEYHWHSYVQDFYILEMRVVKIIGSLKNDLPRYNLANPELAKKLLDHLKTQTEKSLKNARDLRGKHVHDETIRNFDLTRAKLFSMLKEHASFLNIDSSQLDIKIKELSSKSKKEFVDTAIKNEEQIKEFKEFFAPRFGHIFATLNGHDVSIFTMS